MAPANRKKKFSIKFELSPAGLGGVGVVCFCIFLWMFLLGVWAGQTILTTGHNQVAPGKDQGPDRAERQADQPISHPSAPAGTKDKPAAPVVEEVVPNKVPPPPALAGVDDSSYFAVQVGAFKESSHAKQALKQWQGKGYQAFSRPPEGADDHYTRVYLGRFSELAEARKQAEELERTEKLKPFIATIPAAAAIKP